MNFKLIRKRTVIFEKSQTIPDTEIFKKFSLETLLWESQWRLCMEYFILGCGDKVFFPEPRQHAVI